MRLGSRFTDGQLGWRGIAPAALLVMLLIPGATAAASNPEAPASPPTTVASPPTTSPLPAPPGNDRSGSPPTTIPQPPTSPQPQDPPQRFITAVELAVQAAPGEALGARRVVLDSITGEVVAVGEPNQPLVPVGESTSQAVAAAVSYQTDRVYLNDNTTQDVYNVDLWIYIAPPQCSDSDTCSGGVRKTSGYVWFPALQVNIGNSPSECLYAMHAGIGMGNGFNDWFFDWSGYSECGATSLGEGKGHGISLDHDKWYRVRIWRLAPSGSTWPWGAWVAQWNMSTNQLVQEWYGGSWSLSNGRMVSYALYWTEIAEPNPCPTDYFGTHNLWVEYRDPSGKHIYTTGTANYEATCANTNLRDVGADSNRYTIDDREVTRTNPNGYVLF